MNHPFADGPLEFGKLFLWQPEYREFACSRETFEWLQAGAMTHVDGLPVRLQVMDTLVGGFNVMVKIWDAPALIDSARELQAEQWVAA